MNRSKTYSAQDVNRVNLDAVCQGRQGQAAVVGIDVGKYELRAVLRWPDGRFERPWKVRNPEQLGVLLDVFGELSAKASLTVALEPSGTYGDALRQALSDRGIATHRVSPKAAHDYAEVFDGVPSQHDGKDAAVVAELCGIGKSDRWEYRVADEVEQEIGYWVDRMDTERHLLQRWCGKLEGRLARHWPEVTRELKVSGATLLKALAAYGGPGQLAGDANAAGELKRFGKSYLLREKIDRVLDSAERTLGVRQTAWDERRMKDYAQRALSARKEMRLARIQLRRLTRSHLAIQAMSRVVGLASACVLWVCAGDPRDYFCAGAYSKALGLNLTERSSGTQRGKLRISKRGKAMSRRWLYLAAMRWVRHASVRPWYERKKARDGQEAKRALVAVMRKLSKALHQVAGCGVEFDPRRLFAGMAAADPAVA